MTSRILIINGHPDPRPERLCTAIADAYAAGAQAAGRQIRRIDVGALNVPLLHTMDQFRNEAPGAEMAAAQEAIRWATHIVFIHPLWLGGQPAMFRAFLEQVFRYGFALADPGSASGSASASGLLKGRSARIIVTMGMPAIVFRLAFGAWGARAFERGVLWLCGVSPIRRTVLGGVETASLATRKVWLGKVRRLGAEGA